MKTNLIVALWFGVALTGCTHKHLLHPDAGRTGQRLNDRALSHKARVIMRDGERREAVTLRFGPDSTSWSLPYSGEKMTVATKDVAQINFASGSLGALEGALFGAGIGVLAALVTVLPKENTRDNLSSFASLFAFSGAVHGAWIGALVKRKDRYIVVYAPPEAGDGSKSKP